MCHTGAMPERSRRPKRPRDISQLAHVVVKVAAEGEPDIDDGKNPAAVALGRLGGKKGGKARAEKLSPERRSEIARRAALARWRTDDR